MTPKKAKARVKSVAASPVKTDPGPWPFVEVLWHDATSESNWKSEDDLPNVSCICTRGWLVRTTKVCITVAASVGIVDAREEQDKKADVGEIITIPRGCVRNLNELVLTRKAKKKVTLN